MKKIIYIITLLFLASHLQSINASTWVGGVEGTVYKIDIELRDKSFLTIKEELSKALDLGVINNETYNEELNLAYNNIYFSTSARYLPNEIPPQVVSGVKEKIKGYIYDKITSKVNGLNILENEKWKFLSETKDDIYINGVDYFVEYSNFIDWYSNILINGADEETKKILKNIENSRINDLVYIKLNSLSEEKRKFYINKILIKIDYLLINSNISLKSVYTLQEIKSFLINNF